MACPCRSGGIVTRRRSPAEGAPDCASPNRRYATWSRRYEAPSRSLEQLTLRLNPCWLTYPVVSGSISSVKYSLTLRLTSEYSCKAHVSLPLIPHVRHTHLRHDHNFVSRQVIRFDGLPEDDFRQAVAVDLQANVSEAPKARGPRGRIRTLAVSKVLMPRSYATLISLVPIPCDAGLTAQPRFPSNQARAKAQARRASQGLVHTGRSS